MQEKTKLNSEKSLFAQNFKHLRISAGLNQEELAEKLGVKRDNITSYERGFMPKVNTLVKIVKFFQIALEDLCELNLQINGTFPRSINQNPLIKPTNDPTNISKSEKSLVGFGEPIEKYGINERTIKIPIMDTYAGASTQGFLTQGYIDEKDVISIPANMLQAGRKYVCFQVKGESMLPTLHDKDYVIAKFIEITDYETIIDNSIYAVITQSLDMIIKRVQNHSDAGYLLCYPDNIYHNSTKVKYEDILQVFEVAARLTLHLEQTPIIENLERVFKSKQ